jgi:hypothetical protein
LLGTTWRIVPPAPLMAGIGAQFNAVSCPAGPTFWSGGVAAYCVAVGSYANTSQQGGTLAEVYQGSAWSLEKTPAIAAGESSLASVSCFVETTLTHGHLPSESTECTAVGWTIGAGKTVTLVEHADEQAWKLVPVPADASSQYTAFYGVSCPQPTSCVAVGQAVQGQAEGSFAEIENLNHWSIVATPRPSDPGAYDLVGVWCPRTIGACEAVGTVSGTASVPITEEWDGHHWAVQASAGPSKLSGLAAVACSEHGSSALRCTAVGSYQRSAKTEPRTLALRH